MFMISVFIWGTYQVIRYFNIYDPPGAMTVSKRLNQVFWEVFDERIDYSKNQTYLMIRACEHFYRMSGELTQICGWCMLSFANPEIKPIGVDQTHAIGEMVLLAKVLSLPELDRFRNPLTKIGMGDLYHAVRDKFWKHSQHMPPHFRSEYGSYAVRVERSLLEDYYQDV